jgi:hypothetical protein
MVTNLVGMQEEGSDTASTDHSNRSLPRSSITTSLDFFLRIPPRPSRREMEVCLPTTSTPLQKSHPVLEMLDQVMRNSGTSGLLVGPYKGVSSHRLELTVWLSPEDGDAMLGALIAGCGNFLVLEGEEVIDVV